MSFFSFFFRKNLDFFFLLYCIGLQKDADDNGEVCLASTSDRIGHNLPSSVIPFEGSKLEALELLCKCLNEEDDEIADENSEEEDDCIEISSESEGDEFSEVEEKDAATQLGSSPREPFYEYVEKHYIGASERVGDALGRLRKLYAPHVTIINSVANAKSLTALQVDASKKKQPNLLSLKNMDSTSSGLTQDDNELGLGNAISLQDALIEQRDGHDNSSENVNPGEANFESWIDDDGENIGIRSFGEFAELNDHYRKTREVTDDDVVSGSSFSFADALKFYRVRYLNQFLFAESQTDQLSNGGGNIHLEAAAPNLKVAATAAFEQHVRSEGFLTADLIQAELEKCCREFDKEEQEYNGLDNSSKLQPWQALQSPILGPLFKGLLRLSMLVDSTIQTMLSTQPILTLHDLKEAITSAAREDAVVTNREPVNIQGGPVIGRRMGLANKGAQNLRVLGKLEYHPMIRKHFHLEEVLGLRRSARTGQQNSNNNSISTVNVEFPDLPTERLIKYLFSSIPTSWGAAAMHNRHRGRGGGAKAVQNQMQRAVMDTVCHNAANWTVEIGLRQIQREHFPQLSSYNNQIAYRALGVFVQDTGVVRAIMCRLRGTLEQNERTFMALARAKDITVSGALVNPKEPESNLNHTSSHASSNASASGADGSASRFKLPKLELTAASKSFSHWEELFQEFEGLKTPIERYAFCEALTARDLGLDLKDIFQESLRMIVAKNTKNQCLGKEQVLSTKLKTPLF